MKGKIKVRITYLVCAKTQRVKAAGDGDPREGVSSYPA
tara:strand:+ start:545 stop:658 length:114 start_codon:yes stop_codon:yes gene_type:complete